MMGTDYLVSTALVLVAIGVLSGLTTVLFGFGGGFVAVPVVTWVHAQLGGTAVTVAIATSAAVMLVNAGVATAATPRATLRQLRGSGWLLPTLALGGAVGALIGGQLPGAVVRWAFLGYLAVTILDVLLRPGFLRPVAREPAQSDRRSGAGARLGVPAAVGFPVGALAAALGVGGSVMTVPLLRRSGARMAVAAALANPLTLVISAPALLVFVAQGAGVSGPVAPVPGIVGAVDLVAASALLLGAVPVIVWLRRRPLRIPDRIHTIAYPGLLLIAGLAMLLAPEVSPAQA